MQELSGILSDATRAIDAGYFHLSIDGGDPVYRERCYCYELYHQTRLLWPRGCSYRINGEIDKAAHPILRGLGADRVKPDFLIHTPGDMRGNHAIIEVKCARTGTLGVRKDLRMLSTFINKVGYQRAIYLFYGDECDDRLIERIKLAAAEVETIASIELWTHCAPGQSAKVCALLGRKAREEPVSAISAV
jgi:hypothetical protein